MVVAHLNCASGSRGSAESLSRDCDEDDEVLSLSSTAGNAALDDDDDDEEEEEEEEDADEEENDAPNKPYRTKPNRWYKPYAPPAKQPGPEAEARRKPRERRESKGNDMLCYV